jgi:uncharacterized protein (DUF58 family)
MPSNLLSSLFPMLSNLLRGPRVDTGRVTLDRRRIFILPTRRGIFFALLLLLLLLGSINYALSLGFVLTFLLAGLGHVAMLHTYRNLRGVQMEPGAAPPVFVGDTAQFFIGLEAPGPRSALGLHFKKQTPTWMDLLEPGAQSLAIPLAATRRGWLAPGRFTVFTNFPLGLFRTWSYVDFGTRCLVYPRPLPGPLLTQGDHAEQGGTHSTQQEGADDFSALREYHLGDAPRHVAWKASTKSDRLLTKQFVTPGANTLWFDWDTLTDADIETRLSRLTGMVLEAERMQRPYGLRLPGISFAPDLGAAQRERCLKALALFGIDDASA